MTKPKECPLDDDGQPDHDWRPVRDWYGDPDVINGTADCSFLRCRRCGEEDHETPFLWSDYDDDRDY